MGDAGVLMQNWALCFTVRPDASPLRLSCVHLYQGRFGFREPEGHLYGT